MDEPLVLTNMFSAFTMPTAKVGYAMGAQPRSKSPVGGAAAGRSYCVTATVKMKTARRNVKKPNQVSQPRCEKVRMDEQIVSGSRIREQRLLCMFHDSTMR